MLVKNSATLLAFEMLSDPRSIILLSLTDTQSLLHFMGICIFYSPDCPSEKQNFSVF